MLGISWFWFYGAIFLAQFPLFTKGVLGGDEHVFTLLLALFSIGIGVGSLLCERLSGRKVEIGLVPVRLDRPTLFAIDLWLATRAALPASTGGRCDVPRAPARTGASSPTSCCSALFGGFYMVPLYALMQTRSQPSHRSRIIAANNILNALFIIVSALVRSGSCAQGSPFPSSSWWSAS